MQKYGKNLRVTHTTQIQLFRGCDTVGVCDAKCIKNGDGQGLGSGVWRRGWDKIPSVQPPTSREIPNIKLQTSSRAGRLWQPQTMKFNKIHQCSLIFTQFGRENKKIKPRMNTDEAQIILSLQTAGAGVPVAWGCQNEAKTKPKCEAALAINGLIKFVKCPGLRGNAEFLDNLRPRAMGHKR